MIAFVGSGMASDNQEMELLIKSKEAATGVLTQDKMDCKEMQAATVKHAKEVEGMNDKDATTAGFMIYFWCKSENVGEMTLSLQPSK